MIEGSSFLLSHVSAVTTRWFHGIKFLALIFSSESLKMALFQSLFHKLVIWASKFLLVSKMFAEIHSQLKIFLKGKNSKSTDNQLSVYFMMAP